MIKVEGSNRPTAPERARAGARPASAEFRLNASAPSGEAGAAQAAAAPDVLSALIALQSDSERAGARKRAVVAAQRTLDLLDRLRFGLLDEPAADLDLDRLAQLAGAPLRAPAGEEGLQAVLDEIGLRARVELAKRGR